MSEPRFVDVTDSTIATFLDGAPTADTWKSLHQSLSDRLTHLREQVAIAPESDQPRLAQQLATLTQQVQALAQEEAISRFVEDSIRATIAFPRPDSIDEDE